MNLAYYQTLISSWSTKEQAAAAKKLHDYAGGDDVLGLLKATAARRGISVWEVWQDWGWRHVIPIEYTIERLSKDVGEFSQEQRQVLAWRLADLLGYVYLGLALIEEEKADGKGSESFASIPAKPSV